MRPASGYKILCEEEHMIRALRAFAALTVALFCTGLALAAAADEVTSRIGIVVMHGKGGSPTKYVTPLASALEEKGYLVANLEMPWSGQRDYDADVSAAEKQVASALETLRGK